MKHTISHYQLELARDWNGLDFYKNLISYDYILTRDDHNGLMVHMMPFKPMVKHPVTSNDFTADNTLRSFVWTPTEGKFREINTSNLSSYTYLSLINYLMMDSKVRLIEFTLLDKNELIVELNAIPGAMVAWLELKLEKNE